MELLLPHSALSSAGTAGGQSGCLMNQEKLGYLLSTNLSASTHAYAQLPDLTRAGRNSFLRYQTLLEHYCFKKSTIKMAKGMACKIFLSILTITLLFVDQEFEAKETDTTHSPQLRTAINVTQ